MIIYKTTLSVIIAISLLIIPSCGIENESIIYAGELAWHDVEDAIDNTAEELCNGFAESPQSLYHGGCEVDFNSLIDNFTMIIPLDRTTHLAAGLMFGDDAADFFSSMDNYSRNNMNKQDARKDMLKHFNSSWATLMTSLIILDGDLSYELETDDLISPSFDFDRKDLYDILNEEGYFNGAYGDHLPQN